MTTRGHIESDRLRELAYAGLYGDLRAIGLLRSRAVEATSFEVKKRLWNASSRLNTRVESTLRDWPEFTRELIFHAAKSF